VSDERDGADAPITDAVDDDARGGAVPTGAVTPPRPSGKRSRQRALAATAVVEDDVVEDDDTTDAKPDTATAGAKTKTKTPKKKKTRSGGSSNPFTFVFNYIKQVIAELRKVIWPNRKQMVSYTSVVLVFLAFMVALIGGVDLGLAKLVLWVFG